MVNRTVRSPEEAARVIRKVADSLQDSLSDTQPLASSYAEAILREAQANASRRPTPQAPMVGSAMGVRGDSVVVLSGGTPAEVSGGSEWGSDIYTQFGPRNEGGWWLFPAAESVSVQEAGDRYLEQITEKAVRDSNF